MPKVTEIDVLKNKPATKDEGRPLRPIPSDVLENEELKYLFQHRTLGIPKNIWVYRDANGEPVMFVCRYIDKQGKKHDLPWTYREYKDGKKDWDIKSIPTPRLLYNRHSFDQHPEKPVLVCEGEKAAEAASKLFPDWTSTTSSNGAGNAKSCDWSPCENRHVVIWPDNDDAGFSHAKDVARLCLKVGAASVRIVQIPEEFAEKWDLADELPDGMDVADVQKLIDEAEDVVDPLDDLVERAKEDVGTPFVPEVLEAMSELKRTDRRAFENLRNSLRREAKVRVTELDKALREESAAMGDGDDISQTDILLEIAEQAELFHTPDDVSYADVQINGHRETWAVNSTGFKRWLKHGYLLYTDGRAPGAEAVNAALGAIDARAYYQGPERDVFIRVAEYEGKTYIDMCDNDWRVIEVDASGWRIIPEPPVRFRRTSGMLPLPEPDASGSIEVLRSFLNVSSKTSFILVVSWLLLALRGKGPYPVLVLLGEHGSAKSTFSRLMRLIVDPNSALLRVLREERDMFISANNGHVLAFDNISNMNAAISDTLCRLSTGGSLVTRQLYTDQDEVMFNAIRPIILNGIEDVVTRPDLADRSIFLTLDVIPDANRKLEEKLFKEFGVALPAILGALLNALSAGLRNLPETKLDRLPRMADFALFSTACETALWGTSGAFMNAYDENRASTIDDVLDASPVANAIRLFMAPRESWTGTATELLEALSELVVGNPDRSWPKSGRGMSGQLRRAAPFLRQAGLNVSMDQKSTDRDRKRLIIISKQIRGQPSEPSRSSEEVDCVDGMDE